MMNALKIDGRGKNVELFRMHSNIRNQLKIIIYI